MATIHNRLDKLTRYKDNNYGSNLEDENAPIYSIESLFPENSGERSIYEQIARAVLSKYSHLKVEAKKHYVAFKKDRKHNFIAIWPKSGWVEVVLCAKQGSLKDDDELTYDISNRQWPAAQYALRYDENTDLELVMKLINQI